MAVTPRTKTLIRATLLPDHSSRKTDSKKQPSEMTLARLEN